MFLRLLIAVTMVFLLVLVAGDAFAQPPPDTGARFSGFIGGSFGDGDTTVAIGAAVGFRVTRYVGWELEWAYIPSLDLVDTDDPRILATGQTTFTVAPGLIIPFIFPPFRVSGRAITFLSNFVAEFPTAVHWLRPYLLAGGGLANVSQQVDFGGRPIPLGLEAFFPLFVESSRTDLALTTGGGVDFQIWRGLAIGGDLRYLHIFGEGEGFDMTRVGTRVSYRF